MRSKRSGGYKEKREKGRGGERETRGRGTRRKKTKCRLSFLPNCTTRLPVV
jgi:hypothetical protein